MKWSWYLLILSVALLVYTWLGYPALLSIARRIIRLPLRRIGNGGTPFVSIILPVHNEEKRIAAKIEDCQRLDYPRDRLELIVACDGCTDRTEEIARRFAAADDRVRLLPPYQRRGKSGAQNLAVDKSRGAIVFFTDANTVMPPETLRIVTEDFEDPQVGAVTVATYFGTPENAVSQGQDLYWRFELFLRSAESALGILATGSGQALAFRRALFQKLPLCYGDDCILPMDVRLQGYRVVQEERVRVIDTMPSSVNGELRARARMTARNWSGTLARRRLLNPFFYPATAVALVSHKLLRWLTPLFLLLCFGSNTVLAFHHQGISVWALQALFYLFALVGWRRTLNESPAWVFGYAFSFCLANVGFLLGMLKVVRQQRIISYQASD